MMGALVTAGVSIWLCCGAVVPGGSCPGEAVAEGDSVARGLTAVEEKLVESNNEFGFRLFREIVQLDAGKSVFISPFSAGMALSMTYNGAGGETAEAMKSTLKLEDLKIEEVNEGYKDLIGLVTTLDARVRFDIGNSIWYMQGMKFRKEFLRVNSVYFDAEVTGLDFRAEQAVKTINEWVKEETNEKIEEIISAPIPEQMVMLLINAIYFKGTWTYEFDQKRTRDDYFTLSNGSKSPCRMMALSREFEYLESEELQAIDLPYGDGAFRMTVLLPKKGVTLNTLIDSLNERSWERRLKGFRRTKVGLELPRFKMEYEITMNDVLKALGMGIAFDEGAADFSGMYAGPEPLSISEVKHKTFVQVDEEGTEAAAVTSVGMVVTSLEPSPVMRVDRPFVFVIRDSHTKAVLFMGKIVEPTWEE
jgi:serpin B